MLVLLVSACSKPEPVASAPAAPPGRVPGLVQHIVICWLKQPGDPMARAQLIGTSLAFKDLPGVVEVTAGTALPGGRDVVDASFDVAIVMTFRDEAALRAYERHPVHKKAVQEILLPLVERHIIYDFITPP